MDYGNIPIGSKFYRYIDGYEDPEVIRVINVNKIKNKVKYYDSNWNKKSMTFVDLVGNYNMLTADGSILASIVSIRGVKDVIVGLGNLRKNTNEVYAICRQNIFDFFSNFGKDTSTTINIGMSISRDTCPSNANFNELLACDKIVYKKHIVVYLDDTLDNILKLLDTKKFDKVLEELYEDSKVVDYTTGTRYVGFAKSLEELLRMNNFMFDFRRCFGIDEVPFTIDPSDTKLSLNNLLYLENKLKVNILDTSLIKYTREVDLKSIKRDYMLITSAADGYNETYILAYDVSQNPYVNRCG